MHLRLLLSFCWNSPFICPLVWSGDIYFETFTIVFQVLSNTQFYRFSSIVLTGFAFLLFCDKTPKSKWIWPGNAMINAMTNGIVRKRHGTQTATSQLSQYTRFPTMWYVRPAKPQISLRIRAVWSEHLLIAWVFYDCWATDWTQFGVS